MQEALPYKTWLPIPPKTSMSMSSLMNHKDTKTGDDGRAIEESKIDVKSMASENAVVVFGRRGCCMSHVVKRLLQSIGVNPVVFDVEEEDEAGVAAELGATGDGKDRRVQFPAVFIGGRLFGGLDRIMATHITGELVPVLKAAGALWL